MPDPELVLDRAAYAKARKAIRDTYNEVTTFDLRLHPDRFAETLLARLTAEDLAIVAVADGPSAA